jgi:hypothetical protein
VFVGNGDGTFQTGQSLSTSALGTGNVVVADFNGDGKLDLAVSGVCSPSGSCPSSASGPSPNSAGVLLGNGDGTFQTVQHFGSVGSFYGSVPGLALGDLTGGKPDLVATGLCADASCGTTNPEQSIVGVLFNTTTFPNSAATATVLHSSLNPANAGQSITFTPTVSSTATGNTPTGTVTLLDGSTSLGVYALNGSGVTTATIPTLAVGTQSMTATYNGDAHFSSSNAAALSQVILGVTLTPASLNFENQYVGGASSAQTVTLTNSETAAISIAAIAINGTNSDAFSQTNNCPSSLAASATCSVTVTFSPTTSGNFGATLSVSDSLPRSPQTATLIGNGVIPPLSVSPSSITFPDQYVGSSGPSQTVTLTNNGTSGVTISNVASSSAAFGVVSACGSTLAAGSSCSIGVSFDPTQGGAQPGTLTVTDSANSPLTMALSGNGQGFSLAPSLSTATVTPGASATYSLSVVPLGGFTRAVTLSCSGAPADSTCSISPSSFTLNGSSPTSATVTVSTSGSSASLARPVGSPPNAGQLAFLAPIAGLPGLALVGIWGGSRKGRGRVFYGLVVFCLLSAVAGMSACGGSSNNGNGGSSGTPAGTYTLTITGTYTSGSTSLTQSKKLPLVVQ